MEIDERQIEQWGGTDRPVQADPFVQLALVDAALADLEAVPLADLDREWFARLARSVDEVLARVDAFAVGVAAEAERRGHDRDRGFFSTKAYIKHHVQLPGPEAHGRMQTVRMFELLPPWAAAARTGEVGVAQTRLMARVASNPRVSEALVACVDRLLADAIVLSYDEFERRLRDFERSADQDGAGTQARRNQEARDAGMRQQADGSWRLWAKFGSLQGAEVNEVFAHFVHAEWEADWAEARTRRAEHAEHAEHADCTNSTGVDAAGEPTMADLARIEPQRRADAVAAAFRAAAVAPASGAAPLPTLNVLIDEATLEVAVTGGRLDPERYAEMVCRTRDGAPIDLSEAASLALWAHLRRVVRDGEGVVIDLGRRSRAFVGSSREAVMLSSDRCTWPGCDRPTRHCQSDHSLSWGAHGNTVPRNGAPMCRGHNLLKFRGAFTARRTSDGSWTISDADGEPVA